jgi:hypothetical protein
MDKNETFKFIFMIVFVSIGMINIQFGDLIFGVSMMLLLCIFALYRMFMQNGSIVGDYVLFDRKLYHIPVVGEKILITKLFYWDGAFKKFINESDPSGKPWWFTIRKGDEFEVISVLKVTGDWEIGMVDKAGDKIVVNYFESRKYWKTKSDIRDERLRKIGI